MEIVKEMALVPLVGIGATAALDLWLMLLKRPGLPTFNFALMGRWAGHWARGRFAHEAIGKAAPVRGEVALGWLLHYAAGIAFAGVLALAAGLRWMSHPTFLPAILTGVLTVAVPWFVMQPAMGAGIASSRTPAPMANRFRSLANHAVFGCSLYGAAVFINWIY